MDPSFVEAISREIRTGIFEGLWTAFKWTWWLFPLAIVFRIFEKWANRKIDNWKRRRKLQK
jgi:hypothetical protein